MVSREYSTAKPPPPPPWKRVFDQHVVPAAIDVAGALEGAVTRGLERARREPGRAALASVAALGVPLFLLLRPRRA
jgi:hypothetical protein